METTEKKIERGSFEFFAQLCRSNTGAHPLDSGGAYGRNYDKPLPVKDAEPFGLELTCAWIPFSVMSKEQYELFKDSEGDADWQKGQAFLTEKDYQVGFACSADAFISLAHFLYNTLENDEVAEQLQEAFVKHDTENPDESYLENLKTFLTDVAPDLFPDLDIVFNEKDRFSVGNSYNEDNDLDQNVQWLRFEVDGETFYAIQPHNGCDIRGGYPMPEIFKTNGENMFGDWRLELWEPTEDLQFDTFYEFTEGRGYNETYETRCVVGKTETGELYPVPQVKVNGEWLDCRISCRAIN